MADPIYYKVLAKDGSACNGGSGKWSLPTDAGPGEWMPAVEGPIQMCSNGYHLVPFESLFDWVREQNIVFVAEGRGDRAGDGTGWKIAFREARLLRKTKWDDGVELSQFMEGLISEFVFPEWDSCFPNNKQYRDRIREAVKGGSDGIKALDEELAGAHHAAVLRTQQRFSPSFENYLAMQVTIEGDVVKALNLTSSFRNGFHFRDLQYRYGQVVVDRTRAWLNPDDVEKEAKVAEPKTSGL